MSALFKIPKLVLIVVKFVASPARALLILVKLACKDVDISTYSGLEEDKLDIKISHPITILEIGTKVRLQLFIPIAGAEGYTTDKTRFRTADIRWKNKISKITNIVIRPNSPIYYSIDNNDAKLFLRNQLQVVGDDERGPPITLLTTKTEKRAYTQAQANRA
jgi:hypothetical protein